MASTCDINRQAPEDLENLKKVIEKARITESDILGMTSILEDISAEAAVKHLVGDVVPEEDIKEYIEKVYGKYQERYLLAIKIAAISAANPLLSDMIHEAIYTHMPVARKQGRWLSRGLEAATSPLFGKGGLNQKEFEKLSKEEQLQQMLKVLPVGTLKVVYKRAWDWANASNTFEKKGIVKGLIGKFLTQFHGPKQLALKEHTGAYFKLAKHLTRYYTDIEGDIGDFMYSRTIIRNGKEVKILGMTDIIKGIEAFENTTPNWKVSKDTMQLKKEILTEFLIMNMTGEIFYDEKSGKFMANKDYAVSRDPAGKALIWPDSGRVIHSFQNPIDISKFQNGRYDFKFTKSQIKEFLDLKKSAREIDDRVRKNSTKRHAKSVQAIKNALYKHFPDLNASEIDTLFFENWKLLTIQKIVDKMKAHDKAHKTNYHKKYKLFKGTFGDYISPALFVNQAAHTDEGEGLVINEGSYKENHFPIKYPDQIFKIMWDNYIDDLKAQLKSEEFSYGKYTKQVKEGKKFNEKAVAFYKRMKDNIEILKQSITRAEEISLNKDGIYPEDNVAGKQMPFVRDQKHLKTITNAFDVRLMRKDAGVYYDYLQEVYSSINRNNLTATLLESLLISTSENVDKTLINYYKVPFNDPSTEGGFGLLTWSDEKLSGLLGNYISPAVINRLARLWSKIFTGTMLGGVGTAMINKMAIAQTAQDQNINEIRRALKMMSDHKEEVEAFVAKSGVTAFADFFSRALVNGKAGVELDNFTVEKIYAAMLNFPSLKEQFSFNSKEKLIGILGGAKRLKRLKKEDLITLAAKKEIEKQFQKILKDSPNFNLKIGKILDKDRLDKRLKLIAQSKFDNAVNKFVQYALSKEYEINRYAKVLGWKYKAPKAVYQGLGGLADILGIGRKTMQLTMSDTEAWIRTVSFMVGVLKAQDLGYIRSDVNPWKLTGDELRKAIEIGRLVSNYSNMGLSSTDVGATAYGSIGALMQKFNLWGLQKRGRDMRVIKNAITVQKDLLDLGKSNLFDVKAISKMIGKGSYNYWKFHDYDKMNLAQKETAQLYKFLTIGVLPALILDLIVWGPLGNLFGFSLIKSIGTRTGFSSAIRGLPSQVAQLVSIPIAFGLRMAWGDDDDEEKDKQITRFINQYTRTLPMGFMMTYPIEFVLFFYLLSQQGFGDETRRKGMDILRPFFLDNTTLKVLHEGTEQIIEAFED